ncbi:hypothetical protein [Actinomadura latina]|uniref:Secreted protein n=1 Tax=Actinomadura latina TaxID=163603 RepID=A0A846Z9S7_9ACTN|nr:hypothetical protein [Actinomadura latina]NKZ08497.1 hypothetical protein [Actinomadura latina]
MRKLGKIAIPLVGSAALLVGMAGTALASGTITSGGSPYTGSVIATNLGNVTLAGNSFLGPIINSCSSGSLGAYTKSDGTSGRLDSVSLSGCTNNRGGTTTVTAIGLPYTGGHVDYAPVTGGRDGKIVIDAPNAAVDIKAILNLPAWGLTGVECHYGLTTTTPLNIDVYNPSNANKPVPSNPHGQGKLAGQSLQFISGDSVCPASASANGNFQIVTSPGGNDLLLGP